MHNSTLGQGRAVWTVIAGDIVIGRGTYTLVQRQKSHLEKLHFFFFGLPAETSVINNALVSVSLWNILFASCLVRM